MVKTGYNLSRAWFEWCFQNPDKATPNHTALYFWCVELCNRLGWKEKFGLPTDVAKEAIGMTNYKTYLSTLLDLEAFGFITIVQRSANQHTANVIALINFTKADIEANTKAVDNAILNHEYAEQRSTGQQTNETAIAVYKNPTYSYKHIIADDELRRRLGYDYEGKKPEEIVWDLEETIVDLLHFLDSRGMGPD